MNEISKTGYRSNRDFYRAYGVSCETCLSDCMSVN